MIYSYYPGCTLKDRAKEMDKYARASAAALGIELREIPEWQCCGAYVALENKNCAETQVDRALGSAIMNGCEELITACPLCMYNLVENATQHKLPVRYFTELLAEALGVKEG